MARKDSAEGHYYPRKAQPDAAYSAQVALWLLLIQTKVTAQNHPAPLIPAETEVSLATA